MKLTEGRLENGNLVVALFGHVDASNAKQVEEEIRALRAENPEGALILDLDELSYISSAGLRVVLRLRKEEKELRLINASGEVYEIFDMTGFTEMVPIEKAYRRVSVDGCEVVGEGANGKVYRLDPETIIKVYRNPNSLPEIQRERELARAAFVRGVPTAISYEVVRVGDSYGSVFELLNAKSLAKRIAAEPERLDEWVTMYVDLLKKIHATEVEPGTMPDMRQVALGWADFLKPHLPEADAAKLRALIAAVPEDCHLMHGDYHIKNVMLQDGEALLIDMDTLCMGHPVFEFASIFLAYVGFSELNPDIVANFLGVPCETARVIWDMTLEKYFDGRSEAEIAAIADRAKVVGYARLMRRTIRRDPDSEHGRAQIELCRRHLAELLARVDALTF